MKSSTKFFLGVGTALAGVWAWMRFGSRAALAASRVTPPGYVQQRYLLDRDGRQIALQSIYPTVNGVTRTYTVPIDPLQRGYWGTLNTANMRLSPNVGRSP